VSHLGGPEEFGRKLWTEAERRQWTRALETQVVTDGATWIWNLVQDHFRDSHQVVDWFYAKEHLALAAQLICGDKSPAAKRWLNEYETDLFQDTPIGLLKRSGQPQNRNLRWQMIYCHKRVILKRINAA